MDLVAQTDSYLIPLHGILLAEALAVQSTKMFTCHFCQSRLLHLVSYSQSSQDPSLVFVQSNYTQAEAWLSCHRKRAIANIRQRFPSEMCENYRLGHDWKVCNLLTKVTSWETKRQGNHNCRKWSWDMKPLYRGEKWKLTSKLKHRFLLDLDPPLSELHDESLLSTKYFLKDNIVLLTPTKNYIPLWCLITVL